MSTPPVRLARRVAELSGCSRAEAEQYIRNGWVTVDGVVIEAPQHKVADEQVELDTTARLDKDVRPSQLQAMCAQVGLQVLSIRRLRIGRIALGKGPEGAMPPGQWRYLPVGERF